MSSFNIILFGEAGVGKSSVINLIADKKIAETSSDSWGCTLKSQQYMFRMAQRNFTVWDTVGLQESSFSVTNYLAAIEKTYFLIQQITAKSGLDLLLFCIPGSGARLSQTMLCNYRLFYEVLCEKRIPIALVVTQLENEERMEDWWVRNGPHFDNCGLKFSGHACVTALPGHEKAEEGRAALKQVLLSYGWKGRYAMPSAPDWHIGFLRRLAVTFMPRSSEMKDKRKELERMLLEHCKMNTSIARQLAKSLTRGGTSNSEGFLGVFTIPSRKPSLRTEGNRPQSRTGMRSSFNIVLFGEAGVGKSSVINLIADKEIAKTSPDAMGCTFESTQYTFPVGKGTFNVWDTMGLGEPLFSPTNYVSAIAGTYKLIQEIEAKGGLDLLLFCIPGSGSRITQTMLSNYRLFFEVFCGGKIPISVVVTRLEGEARMEEWWERNEGHISQSGLKFGGHACITGNRKHEKAAEGRNALKSLFLSYDSDGRYPMPPADAWFLGFLDRLSVIPRSDALKVMRMEVEQLLRERCTMEPDVAEKLAEKLTQ